MHLPHLSFNSPCKYFLGVICQIAQIARRITYAIFFNAGETAPFKTNKERAIIKRWKLSTLYWEFRMTMLITLANTVTWNDLIQKLVLSKTFTLTIFSFKKEKQKKKVLKEVWWFYSSFFNYNLQEKIVISFCDLQIHICKN